MDVVYALQPFPERVTKSLFLAGPTPRSRGDAPYLGEVTWRREAVRMLERMGYDGHVFVPEPHDETWAEDYEEQIEWEEEGLRRADVIAFWVPRDVRGVIPDGNGQPMPAFTTNDEWGHWKASGKVVWGSPPWAEHTRYQKHYADKLGVTRAATLEGTLKLAVELVGEGAEREGNAASIPVHIWRQASFRAWWDTQSRSGNEIRGVDVEWTSGRKSRHRFCLLRPTIWIKAENRLKSNEEVIFFRPDISTVCLYRPGKGGRVEDTKVVLVKEFRAAVENADSYVYEIPGGSSPREGVDALQTAVDEVSEELGVQIEAERLRAHGARQVGATLCGYLAHLFSAELTGAEMAKLEADHDVHGAKGSSERTRIVVRTVGEILDEGLVDWPTMGMILQALQREAQ
jgi:8-oxo-dGTP pyrophosphatase MutT (NUDIX family)